MKIVDSDVVVPVRPGESPDYERGNPLLKVFSLVETVRLAAGREFYSPDHLHYLLPIERLELYGPSGTNADALDPREQDAREDFQKQNIKSVIYGDARLLRGWVAGDGWAAPFLRLTYRGGIDSRLSEQARHRLGERIKVWVRVGSTATSRLIDVPYHPEAHRYAVELWGDPGVGDVRAVLDEQGRKALERGELQMRPDLLQGKPDDFDRERVEGEAVHDIHSANLLHPIRPLAIELAWTDTGERSWDNDDGRNYHYRFGMIVRGLHSYLKIGRAENPHGGPGALEYRDLLSNYFGGAALGELAHDLHSWQFDAQGHKGATARESFVALNYANLSLLHPRSGIGLHRHRDGSEVFFVVRGRGLMVTGDWCRFPDRNRALEVRPLREGDLALIHGGQLHGLLNPAEDDLALLSFGSYD